MHERSIHTVTDTLTQETIAADTLITQFSRKESVLFKERRAIEESFQAGGSPRYLCDCCKQPVHIKGTPDGVIAMHFSHFPGSGDCPWKADHHYTREQIECMKYNGAKESPQHFEMKHFLADRLRDQGFDPRVEEVVRGKGLSKEWKKPDVRVEAHGLNIVFELQLSTTFLDVIVRRERFYRSNDIYIVWVFGNFDLRPFTAKDIIYPNQHHAFVLSEDAKRDSLSQRRLLLECFFPRPHVRKHSEEPPDGTPWESTLVSLEDLTFERDHCRVFYINWEQECSRLEEATRYRDIATLIEFKFLYGDRFHTNTAYAYLDELAVIYYADPIISQDKEHLIRTLSTLYSLREGRVVYYASSLNLISLANNLIVYSPQYIGYLLAGVLAYGHEVVFFARKSVGKKLSAYRAQTREQRPAPCHRYDWLVDILFPEVSGITREQRRALFDELTGSG